MAQDFLKDQIIVANADEAKGIDLRAIIASIVRYWYLFLISIVVCLLLAILYAYHTPVVWKVSGKILVENNTNPSAQALNSGMNEDLGSLLRTQQSNADNEVDLLKSRSLMRQVVSVLNLNVRTYATSEFRSVELYEESPFLISIHYKNNTFKAQAYQLTLADPGHIRIVNMNQGVNRLLAFGQVLALKQYDLIFYKNAAFIPNEKYTVTIETIASATRTFLATYTAFLSSKEATTINLTLNYPNPQKGEVILNKLMAFYLHNNLENKVKIADSTMKFIDNRLAIVGSELGSVEKQLEQYKEQNHIADISTQSKSLVEGASDFYNKLNEIDVQLAVINDLNSYLNRSGNRKVVPSSLTTKDPAFGAAINSYNQLLLERDKQKLSYSEVNPVVKNLNQQIESSRLNLVQSLESYQHSSQISKGELNKQNTAFAGKIRQVPAKDRIFLDYSRQQSVKQELYLFLLQKREETAISKTSTISSSRIVDTAESDDVPFAPKKSVIYLIGLIAGLSLPAAYLNLRKVFNTKVNNKAEIEKKTQVPIIGEIGHNSLREFLVVDTASQSVIAEQFRSLRANLQYILDTNKSNVILFTSSMNGEGKAFLSFNLANALALTGKKVVMVELDLRQPKLSERIGLNNTNGFTNYVNCDTMAVDTLLKPIPNHQNLFLISSGTVPPNPAELLSSKKLETLIIELKNRFDYVIILTPPVGIVADALLIEKFTDFTFYIVRQRYMPKAQLDLVKNFRNNKQIKHLNIIINDSDSVKKVYGGQ